MFLPNPGILAAGAGGGKTYEQFKVHVTALAVDGLLTWIGSFSPSFGPARSFAADAAADETGSMAGSPWGPSASGGRVSAVATVARVMQHGLPSKNEWDAQRLGGYRMFYRVSMVYENAPAASVTRNGYTSGSLFSGSPFRFVEEIIYWDGSSAKRMQPRLGIGPEPYDWED